MIALVLKVLALVAAAAAFAGWAISRTERYFKTKDGGPPLRPKRHRDELARRG